MSSPPASSPTLTAACLDRRERLMAAVGEGVVVVRGAGPGGGLNESFRYLTGVAEPQGVLLLAPHGARIGTGRRYPGRDYVRGRMARQVLFLPSRDPLLAKWGEDAAAVADGARPESYAVDAVLPLRDLPEVLGRALQEAEVLHVVRAAVPALAGPADEDALWVDDVRRRFFGLAIDDATREVHAMRRLKSADEVVQMEQAALVTREAVEHVMRAARPGMREHELEGEVLRVYRSHGATVAFETIVAAGANANLLHYRAGPGRIGAGDLVLLDTGASVAGYRADVTRTFPAGGRFSPRQREVYEVVLRAEQAVIDACRPGVGLDELHAVAWDVIQEAGYAPYFPHGTSHYLGLDTHDVGDPMEPLEPGAVITVEPGVYLPDEGFGVRIEDDVLITAHGRRVLTEAIPRTVEAVEALTAGGK
jgi:Xaa-Pro aminopeptidase